MIKHTFQHSVAKPFPDGLAHEGGVDQHAPVFDCPPLLFFALLNRLDGQDLFAFLAHCHYLSLQHHHATGTDLAETERTGREDDACLFAGPCSTFCQPVRAAR